MQHGPEPPIPGWLFELVDQIEEAEDAAGTSPGTCESSPEFDSFSGHRDYKETKYIKQNRQAVLGLLLCDPQGVMQRSMRGQGRNQTRDSVQFSQIFFCRIVNGDNNLLKLWDRFFEKSI